MRPKWRALRVATEYPKCAAVAPIIRSAVAITPPPVPELRVNSGCHHCDLPREWLGRYDSKDLIEELASLVRDGRGLGAMPTVFQFHDRHHREEELRVGVLITEISQESADREGRPFCPNQDAGVED